MLFRSADLAEEATEAASGALPAGSDVKFSSEARGSQPFQMRLEWLQKQLVLAGTGGLLTMLTESGCGTLAGSAHQGAWEQIVRRVARSIAKPLHRQYDRRALAARFQGHPAQAYFNLRARQEKDVGKVVDNVTALVNAGFDVDTAQVQKETGYTIHGYTRPPAPSVPGAAPSLFRAVCSRGAPGPVPDPLMQSGADALAQAQAVANRPLALAIARVLTAQGLPAMQAAARRLRGELPQVAEAMLADPAQAEAYRRIMSSAFLQGLIKEPAK